MVEQLNTRVQSKETSVVEKGDRGDYNVGSIDENKLAEYRAPNLLAAEVARAIAGGAMARSEPEAGGKVEHYRAGGNYYDVHFKQDGRSSIQKFGTGHQMQQVDEYDASNNRIKSTVVGGSDKRISSWTNEYGPNGQLRADIIRWKTHGDQQVPATREYFSMSSIERH